MRRLNLLVTDEQYEHLSELPNKSEVVRNCIQSMINKLKERSLEKRVEALEKRVEKLEKK